MVAIYKIVASSIPTICTQKGLSLTVQKIVFEFEKNTIQNKNWAKEGLIEWLRAKDSLLVASVKYS